MEQRYDYMESQTDIIARILKKILEKLHKLKSLDKNDSELKNILKSNLSEDIDEVTIDHLIQLDHTELIEMLAVKYHYSTENMKVLGDILYQSSGKIKDDKLYRGKALFLYKQYLLDTKDNVDFLVFTRIKELESN